MTESDRRDGTGHRDGVDRRDDVLDAANADRSETVFADLEGDLADHVSVPDPLPSFAVPVTAADVPADVLDAVRRECDDPDRGFFGPESMVWELFEEQTVYLGVATGIVLQVAHPKVGQGVGEHDTLDERPIERLERTFEAFDAVLFGDVVSAVRAAVTVRTLHERVTGTVEADAGPYDAGEPYYANDPDLLLWVAATIVEVARDTYEAFVAPLSATEVEQFYAEMTLFGELLGVPDEAFPETYDDFRDYYERTIEREIVESPQSRRVVEGFLEHCPATPLARFLTSSLLPPAAREATGLAWERRHERCFDAVSACVGAIPRSLVPARLRYRSGFRRFGRQYESR